MIPELGHFSLILALMVAGSIGFFGLAGGHTGKTAWLAYNKPASRMLWVLIVFSFLCLLWAFQQNDFSVAYVANQSHTLMPPLYRLSASWGGHEGSLLLWLFMLSSWMTALTFYSKQLPERMLARSLGVLALICVGFLLFTLLTSSPFTRLLEPALEGRGLNPMLQDPGLIFHPPLLYMGYVGFAVTFAFAVAGLLEGRFDMTWARWSRPWTNVAWAFLTMGIALGSWWAYRELGWGGWWFWDPVENASLMPWLAGTALIHSLAVSEKRGALRSWTLLLALTTFALSLLGTFLVRSGVLTSVHAFATDPERGVFILALLFLVVGASYILYAMKTGEVGQGGSFKATGRESLLLSNNVLMSAALVAVMLGTLYPLVVEVIGGRKMSVGQPYFEAMFAPILLPALLLMALGPDSRWRETRLAQYIRPGAVALGAAVLVLLGAALFNGYFSVLWAIGVVCAVFMAVATLAHAAVATRKAGAAIPESGLMYRIRRLSLSYWGMVLAHLGVAVFVVGVSWVKTFETETDAVLKPGETTEIGPWRVTFIGVDSVQRSNHVAALGVFELTRGQGNLIHLLEPEKRRYQSSEQIMTEAAIHTDWFSDVYIGLGDAVQSSANSGAWGVRLYYKPLINLIWWGCALMALGGLVTVFDRRYRPRKNGVLA